MDRLKLLIREPALLIDAFESVVVVAVALGLFGLSGEAQRDLIALFIAVLAVRGGEIPGEHTAFLIGESERIEITHRAASRAIFAAGALRAAAWVYGRAPGLYSMKNVLGL